MEIKIELTGWREDIAIQLENIIEKVREGNRSGVGWELTGRDKDDPEEVELED